MDRHTQCDIVKVHPVEVHHELAEIMRQERISQTAVARQVLQSRSLCKMVEAVTSGEIEGIRVNITIRG